MAISTKDFSTIVSDQVAAIQSKVSGLIDLSVGSVLRAITETIAAIVLWLQGLILQLLALTRAATSAGSDLDSWMADFGLYRIAAVASTGNATFSRFTPTNQAVVPVGTTLETADGQQTFTVIADSSNPNYSALLNGYVLAANTSSTTAKVQATTAGAAGNLSVGQLTTLTTPIVGIDTVTNASVFTNGADAESDTNFRARFVSYLASLATGTLVAVGNAISGVQTGLTYSITENLSYAGAAQNGYFYIVLDDGSGAPSTTLQNAVYSAVNAVKPISSWFAVFAPSVVTANIALSVTVASGYDATATKLLVSNAIKTYVNSLAVGATLAYTKIAQTAYAASPGVANVFAVTVNSGTADVTATAKQVIKYGTVAVS